MDNPKYIQVMRQVASDFDGISHELFQVASDLERMDQYNPQQKLFSLVRSAEVSSVTLRNLTARTVRDDTAPFYCDFGTRLWTISKRTQWSALVAAPSALFITMMLLLEKGAFVTMTILKPSGIWMSLNRCY